jgi:hypothetical protein
MSIAPINISLSGSPLTPSRQNIFSIFISTWSLIVCANHNDDFHVDTVRTEEMTSCSDMDVLDFVIAEVRSQQRTDPNRLLANMGSNLSMSIPFIHKQSTTSKQQVTRINNR